MSAYTIEAGDVGTVIQHTVVESGNPLDISLGSSFQLVFAPPTRSGITPFARTAVFATDGTDGVLQYTTQVGDVPWNSYGIWKVQAEFTLGSWSGRSTPDTFTVGKRIYDP